ANEVNTNTEEYIMFCFKEKEGYLRQHESRPGGVAGGNTSPAHPTEARPAYAEGQAMKYSLGYLVASAWPEPSNNQTTLEQADVSYPATYTYPDNGFFARCANGLAVWHTESNYAQFHLMMVWYNGQWEMPANGAPPPVFM
ncbi:MAG: hypothetical protein V3V97_17990, partial [Hyphomicrobiaceae bacterium]